jgi:chemotaxis protein MotA
MNVLLGYIIVLGSVLGGYAIAKGNFSMLIQPAEYIVIIGAAVGSLVIGNPPKVISGLVKGMLAAFAGKGYVRKDYIDLLLLFNDLSVMVRREGLLAIENDVEHPHESKIFKKYPKILGNHEVEHMITDNLRNIISGGIDATQLDNLLDAQIEGAVEEATEPAHALQNMSDGIPGLGIVAAVQGVIITMNYLAEPPEIIGHHVAAALVGTFLGVLLCYGFVGPMARALEGKAKDFKIYLVVLKALIMAVAQGCSPQIVREFGRAMVPGDIRPTVQEMEKLSGK